MDLPEPRFAVPGIIPEGMTALAGKPKLGKSWLALQTALAIAWGGTALGTISVSQSPVLYLALEDTKRRLKNRLQKLAGDSAIPDTLTVATSWPRQNQGGLEKLSAWLTENPDARLVVIDTWQKFRPAKLRGRDSYEEDYEHAAALKALADKFGISILVLHHCRKMAADDPLDEVSGTHGLTGATDGVLVLRRERGQHDAALFVSGRDIDEQELALKWDPPSCHWSMLGQAAEYRLTRERSDVLAILKKEGKPMKANDVAALLDKKPGTVRKLLWELSRDDWVKSEEGNYTVTG
jgi:hypothetical protein